MTDESEGSELMRMDDLGENAQETPPDSTATENDSSTGKKPNVVAQVLPYRVYFLFVLIALPTLPFLFFDVAYLLFDYKPASSTVCDSSLIPSVVDGRTEKNIWSEKTVQLMPCANADAYNIAFMRSVEERMEKGIYDEKTGKLKDLEDGTEDEFYKAYIGYSRSIGRHFNRNIEDPKLYIPNQNPHCLKLNFLSELSNATFPRVFCQHAEWEVDLLTGKKLQVKEDAIDRLNQLQEATLFHAFFCGEYNVTTQRIIEELIHPKEGEENDKQWNKLKQLFEEKSWPKFLDIMMQAKYNDKRLEKLLKGINDKMMTKISLMSRGMPRVGESWRAYMDRVSEDIAPSSTICTSLCHWVSSIFLGGEGFHNDFVYRVISIILYALFFPSLIFLLWKNLSRCYERKNR